MYAGGLRGLAVVAAAEVVVLTSWASESQTCTRSPGRPLTGRAANFCSELFLSSRLNGISITKSVTRNTKGRMSQHTVVSGGGVVGGGGVGGGGGWNNDFFEGPGFHVPNLNLLTGLCPQWHLGKNPAQTVDQRLVALVTSLQLGLCVLGISAHI
ncbi:hypothetical protein HDK77DRAFT_448182 [Phyllosticta capitalensis]